MTGLKQTIRKIKKQQVSQGDQKKYWNNREFKKSNVRKIGVQIYEYL